ncbi:unnamed protein product [Parajaminaea phylloscopi]
MAGHQLKNTDGTVNLEGLSGHVADLKAKYAQNAANFERNTGQPFDVAKQGESGSGGDDATGDDFTKSGAQGHGQVGQARGDADHDAPEGFADAAQPTGQSGHTQGSSISKEDHGSQY